MNHGTQMADTKYHVLPVNQKICLSFSVCLSIRNRLLTRSSHW